MPTAVSVDSTNLRKFSTWFLVYGIILIITGIFSILVPEVATLAAEIFIGWLLLISGLIGIFAVFSAGTSMPGFGWNLLTAFLYAACGAALLWSPLAGVLTLTLFLTAYLLAGGVMQIIAAFGFRTSMPKIWGWVLVSGVIDVALAVLIFSGLPGTAAWVLGLLVGLNLLTTGVALVMAALHARKAATA